MLRSRKLSYRGLLSVLSTLLIAALAAWPLAAEVTIVTNIPGGGPLGQPEDPDCVQEGEFALRVCSPFGDDTQMFVEAGPDQGFDNETTLRSEFWFNPRSIIMDSGARHQVAAVLQAGAGQRPIRATIFYSNANGYTMAAQCTRNCASPPCSLQSSGTIPLQDDWQLIRLEWAQNTAPAPAPGDGICRVAVIAGAGAPVVAERTDMRNNQVSAGRYRLGMLGNSLRPSTDGCHCIDSFQAFRTLASP